MKNNGFLKALSNFKISKYSKIWFAIPAVILLVAIIVIVALGATSGDFSGAVGIGIDFEGGSIITVEYRDGMGDFDEQKPIIEQTIEKHGVQVTYVQESTSGARRSVVYRYKNVDSTDAAINERNERILAAIDALYPEIVNEKENFITYQLIGATAASDLLSKAAIAIVVSTVLILIYIIFRFTLVSGIAAVLALMHDVIILFALTVICRIQINTSFVAAVITIIAYSINNTIIIFDRCRESLKPLKGQKNINYTEIGDAAVRDNITRSVYTTLTTMVAVFFLAVLGSDSIREFAVPIILGLIAGLYSSVFLATPMWSKMSYAYDSLKEKYAARHGVVYDKKDEDEEEIPAKAVANEDDGDDGFTPKNSVKKAGAKPSGANGKKPGKPIYKYSKKNTTFKKK